MYKKKKDYPGCVFVRRNRIFVKYQGKQFKTGLLASPENIEIAKEKLCEEYKRAQISRGELPLTMKEMVIESLWANFIAYQENAGRLKKTLRSYRTTYKALVKNRDVIFEESNLQYLVRNLMNRRDLSPTSKNIYLRHFQSFINWILDYYNIENGNLRKIYRKNKQRTSDKIVEPYTEDELIMLIDRINKEDREFSLLLLFMRYSGFRITETLNLTWDQLDFRNGVIRVPNKIDKSRIESFPITDMITNLLSELKIYRQSGPLWRWKSSSYSRLARRLGAFEKELGIKIANQSFHRFRNTFSNEILTSKILTIPEMSDLMRHKNINTTYKLYHKANISALGQKLNKINSENGTDFAPKSKKMS